MMPGNNGSRCRNFWMRLRRISSLTGRTSYPASFSPPRVVGLFINQLCYQYTNKNQQQNVTAQFRVSSEAPSILLLRLSSLGDIVLTTPLIAAIRERYPASRIELVISQEYESLVPAIQGLTRVHMFDKTSGMHGLRALRKKLKTEQFDHV